MASQSLLRTGVKSPARALMKPASTRSILRRPAPLPLSPNPFPFAANFSVVLSSPKLSPHVHFPPSPSLAATFSTHSSATYDRAPIPVSPTSVEISSWGNRVHSPSVDTFRLSNPPKRSRDVAIKAGRNLVVPLFEDPRSPKPYRTRKGIRFEELSAQAPRGNHATEELSKALSSYPRSPYPSAPVSPAEDIANHSQGVEARGRAMRRWPDRSARAEKLSRTRSLDVGPKRRQNIAPHLSSSHKQDFLSPVQESPRVISTNPRAPKLASDFVSPSGESTRLSQAFWQSVSLEDDTSSVYGTPAKHPTSAVGQDSFASPISTLMFGREDGTLWSPGLPGKGQAGREAEMSILSPAQRVAFGSLTKSMVASPSPHDPFAAFPSFSIALMGGVGGLVAYPPRVFVEQDLGQRLRSHVSE